jgi:hypothetical protein
MGMTIKTASYAANPWLFEKGSRDQLVDILDIGVVTNSNKR